MVDIKWIRTTFLPPIVATMIAICLVSDWGSQAVPGRVKMPDSLTATTTTYNAESPPVITVTRYRQVINSRNPSRIWHM